MENRDRIHPLCHSALMNGQAHLTDHERLDAWQKSMQLLVAAYQIARSLPPHERFEMSSQIRRASLSIPSCSEPQLARQIGRIIYANASTSVRYWWGDRYPRDEWGATAL